MSVTHIDFGEFAAKLLSSEAEIDWRMSAGRSYYGAFHRAQLSVHLCPDNENLRYASHERVSDRFMRHKTMPARSIAYVLQGMKKIRSVADYELGDNFTQKEAVNQEATYQVLVKKLDEFDTASNPKSAIS